MSKCSVIKVNKGHVDIICRDRGFHGEKALILAGKYNAMLIMKAVDAVRNSLEEFLN